MQGKASILIIIFFILVLGGLAAVIFMSKTQAVSIVTDQPSYKKGEAIKVEIVNKTDKTVCFSSCLPYKLEKKQIFFKEYNYGVCPREDIVSTCIANGGTKAFELVTPTIDLGINRIAVPVCFNCAKGDKFIESKKYYSNEFNLLNL